MCIYDSYDNADHCAWFPTFTRTIAEDSTMTNDPKQWALASVLTDDPEIFHWYGGCYTAFMDD